MTRLGKEFGGQDFFNLLSLTFFLQSILHPLNLCFFLLRYPVGSTHPNHCHAGNTSPCPHSISLSCSKSSNGKIHKIQNSQKYRKWGCVERGKKCRRRACESAGGSSMPRGARLNTHHQWGHRSTHRFRIKSCSPLLRERDNLWQILPDAHCTMQNVKRQIEPGIRADRANFKIYLWEIYTWERELNIHWIKEFCNCQSSGDLLQVNQ